ncbi:MAG: hypothetical protein WD708_06685 [Kiritimatiellia bacterium]
MNFKSYILISLYSFVFIPIACKSETNLSKDEIHVYTFLTNVNEEKLIQFETVFIHKLKANNFSFNKNIIELSHSDSKYKNLDKIGKFTYERTDSIIKIKFVYNIDNSDNLSNQDKIIVNFTVDKIKKIASNVKNEIIK